MWCVVCTQRIHSYYAILQTRRRQRRRLYMGYKLWPQRWRVKMLSATRVNTLYECVKTPYVMRACFCACMCGTELFCLPFGRYRACSRYFLVCRVVMCHAATTTICVCICYAHCTTYGNAGDIYNTNIYTDTQSHWTHRERGQWHYVPLWFFVCVRVRVWPLLQSHWHALYGI